MEHSSYHPAKNLTIILIILAIAASAGGILWPEVYQDNDFVKTAWFTNDVITLLVAVPLLITAMAKSKGGSIFWRLIPCRCHACQRFYLRISFIRWHCFAGTIRHL